MAESNSRRMSLVDIPLEEEQSSGRFGTFGGVFTPCVLTIMGVIMFMRMGFVVGQAGLLFALMILVVSKTITLLTSFSISAIATNTDVKVGGVYFMISRVLGLNFGGAIGLTLFLANAVGVAFYVIGFTEAVETLLMPLLEAKTLFGVGVLAIWKGFHVTQIISSILVISVFSLTFRGADIAIKTQYVVLAILMLAVAAFLVGGFLHYDPALLQANRNPAFTKDMSFWAVFAIFFPAATGITAGANMSGDLKNPARSIPWGTILAILFTAGIYSLQIWLTAANTPRGTLVADPFGALQAMSVFSPLVIAGVFAATLSSALGSFLGAPRILQSMGQDRLFGFLKFFAKGSGPANEPRRATVATFLIALGIIWAGDLNAVAEVISMFFLIAYGMINLSAFVESAGANPSFRPRFKWVNRFTTVGGAVGCVIAMVKINETAALIAIAITGAIYLYLTRKNIETDWGDAKRGYLFSKIRDNILALEQTKIHAKNWRPVLVAVAEEPASVPQLVTVAALIEGKRGLLSVADITAAPDRDPLERINLRTAKLHELEQQLKSWGITAFPDAVVGHDLIEAFAAFLQSHGLSQLRPNTVMVAVPKNATDEQRSVVAAQVRLMRANGMNAAVLKSGEFKKRRKGNRMIDVWWRGEKNGSLMTLFAYLVTLNPAWRGAMLRILRIVSTPQEEEQAGAMLRLLLKKARLSAVVDVQISQEPPRNVIARMSSQSDLVFIGMSEDNAFGFDHFLQDMDGLLSTLPTTLIVLSNGDVDLFV
jgi:amino acid transporter